MKTFNEEDLITWANRDKAVIGKRYYFGDSIEDIRNIINDKCKKLHEETLHAIDDANFAGTFIYFDNEDEDSWGHACILPVDKVKHKEPTYRALQTVDELFDFFYPPKDEVYSLIGKAEILLGKKITLKNKTNHRITTMVIKELNFNSNGSDVYLNGEALEWIANDNQIQINNEWQPFGVVDND